MNNVRIFKYDLLKAIALLGIILAHINPSSFTFQLRNFDVPLMVIISVWLSLSAFKKNDFNYKDYIIKRIKRLIIPTWTFLTIYFILNYILGNKFSFKTMILSYTLISGIGYVWVIRIYIYIAILAPILYYIYNKINKKILLIAIIFMYLIYSFLVKYSFNLSGNINLIINVTLLDFIGYSFIIWIAIFTKKITVKKSLILGIFFSICFIFMMLKYDFAPTQNFKCPLRLYYLMYAFSIIYLLNSLLDWLTNKKILIKSKIVIYISKNSMWIYLWHILYLPLVNSLFIEYKFGCLFRFILIIILALITSFIQNKFIYFFKNYILNIK